MSLVNIVLVNVRMTTFNNDLIEVILADDSMTNDLS